MLLSLRRMRLRRRALRIPGRPADRRAQPLPEGFKDHQLRVSCARDDVVRQGFQSWPNRPREVAKIPPESRADVAPIASPLRVYQILLPFVAAGEFWFFRFRYWSKAKLDQPGFCTNSLCR